MGENRNKDLEEMKEMLDVVGEKVPKMFREIVGSIYTKDTATQMGQAVGAYYQELIAAGMPKDVAAEMAMAYSVSLKDMMSGKQFSMTYKDEDKA